MLSHGNVCILLLYGYLYFVAMSKHRTDCTYETRIWRCDRQRLVRLQYSRYQLSQIFRTSKPNDCKNLTFDAVFLSTGRLNIFDRCRPSSKNYVPCLFRLLVQNKHFTLSYFFIIHTCNLISVINNYIIISSSRKSSNRPSQRESSDP